MKAVPSFKLTQEGADIIVNAAIEKAKELKQIVSIAVVDSGGHLFSFKRMTNGRTHNTMIALAKARSAALTTAATGKTNREGGEIPDHKFWRKLWLSVLVGSSASKAEYLSPSKANASPPSVSVARLPPSINRFARPV